MRVYVDDMAGRLGLSVAEFSRYTALGIIKIRVAEVTGDDGVTEVVVQLGNKVLIAVCPADPASIEYESDFSRQAFFRTSDRPLTTVLSEPRPYRVRIVLFPSSSISREKGRDV